MAVLAICPFCLKTVGIEQKRPVCPECGHTLDFGALEKNGDLIDAALEAKEFSLAKGYFTNTEFLSASEHFKKARAANRNSYLSEYFIKLCDIYLNDGTGDFDVMEKAVDAVRSSLELAVRAGVSISDRLNFVTAMLTEIKIIITNRLRGGDELFEDDVREYRRIKISDLEKLVGLFKIDGELMMTYSPNIKAVLVEIGDCAVALCHKAVQTVAVGEDIVAPTEAQYKRLKALCNDYCFFTTSLASDYDVNKYVPDFTQNDLLVEKVESRFAKYDVKNKSNAKKYITGDVKEYESILAECDKAIEFTYINCFRSLCDARFDKRNQMLTVGIKLLLRSLTPRVTVTDKKRIEIKVGKFVDNFDKYNMLNKFMTAADKSGGNAAELLKAFYSQLRNIMDMYFTTEFNRYTKSVNKLKEKRDDDFAYYERFLFDVACGCAVALDAYVPHNRQKDKNKAQIVKFCKQACDEFMLLRDYNVDMLEQSNIYRPILDIYNVILEENGDR